MKCQVTPLFILIPQWKGWYGTPRTRLLTVISAIAVVFLLTTEAWFLNKSFPFCSRPLWGVYMSVGTLTQSTKSAKHSQFSLRAYKLFYQAIYVTLISSQELPLTVMIANRLGNFAHRWVEVLPSFTYLYWSW